MVKCNKILAKQDFLVITEVSKANAHFTSVESDRSLQLHTSIEILHVLKLDEVLSLMTLQLKLTVEWIDSRLEFVHLKKDTNLNILTPQEISKIWMPVLVFTNTKFRQEADFNNVSTFASISINNGDLTLFQ